jgi:hypothetical protein
MKDSHGILNSQINCLQKKELFDSLFPSLDVFCILCAVFPFSLCDSFPYHVLNSQSWLYCVSNVNKMIGLFFFN